MSDVPQQVTVEEVKPVVQEPEVVAKVEAAAASVVASVVPDALKADVEKIVKDILKVAIKELLEDLKKSPVDTLKEVKEQVQKLGCAPACTIS